MDWNAQLETLIPQPAADVAQIHWAAADWTRVETALGRPIPADFKEFSDRWGAGRLADFISLYVPAGPYHPAVVMPSAVTRPAEAYATLKDHHPDRYTLPGFPADGSLMSFAVTDNGDYLGWIVGPGAPESWPVAVWGDEDGVPQVFDGISFGPFLVGLIRGDIRPEAFPDDVWEDVPWPFEPREPRP